MEESFKELKEQAQEVIDAEMNYETPEYRALSLLLKMIERIEQALLAD